MSYMVTVLCNTNLPDLDVKSSAGVFGLLPPLPSLPSSFLPFSSSSSSFFFSFSFLLLPFLLLLFLESYVTQAGLELVLLLSQSPEC